VAYALGILAADAGSLGCASALWIGLHASLALAWLRGTRSVALLACGVALCAGAAAMAWREVPTLRAARKHVRIEARVAAAGASGDRFWLDLAQVRELGGARLRGGVRLYLHDGALARSAPGSWLRAAVRLSPANPLRNPGSRDRRPQLARAGIAAEARLVNPALVATWRGDASESRLAALRRRITARLEREGRGGALLAALAVGARGGLAPATREALGRAGLAHLLAVSGLHLAAVAGLVFAALRRLLPAGRLAARGGDVRLLCIGLALLAAGFYAGLTGLHVPVLRAGIFLLALLLAFWRGAPLQRGHALGLAALVVLVLDPAALFSPGTQLSFAATAGILFAGRSFASEPERLALGYARQLLQSSTAAVAATAPLVAWHFGGASPWGWLANLVAVPVVAVGLLPVAGCAAALAVLAPQAGAPAIAGLSHVAALALDAALAWADASAWGAASAPGPLGLLLGGTLALVALRARSLGVRVLLTAAALAAPGLVPPRAIQPPAPRIVFLDVGQGDAALLQSTGAAVLVDGGVAVPGGPDLGRLAVLPALRALGVKRLDLVVASHADLDHQGGLRAVLRAMPVARLWLPTGGRRDPAFRELLRAARSRAVAVQERGLGGAPLLLPGLRVEPLWPPAFPAAGSRNDRSLVLRAQLGELRVLLPGDLEAPGEAGLLATRAALRAEVLKLPHHGSRTSSTCAFLTAVAPALAVVSAPLHGRFGMPHPQVTRRLARLGIRMAWTGRDGAVLVDALAPLPVDSAAGRHVFRDLTPGGRAFEADGQGELIQADHVPGQPRHGCAQDRPDHALSTAYGEVRADRTTQCKACAQRQRLLPGDLPRGEEDRQCQQREAEVDRDLDAVCAHQIEAAEGESEEQQEAHAGLEGASIQADGEEHQGAQPGGVFLGAASGLPAAKGGYQQREHQEAEDALEGQVR